MAEAKVEYQKLEHSADTGFYVEAPSLERLYINAALALTDMRVSLGEIQENTRHKLHVEGEDPKNLLMQWLQEVLYLFEKEQFLCRRILFEKFDGKSIHATLFGETYDPVRHGHISEIKSVTYHQMEIGEQSDSGLFFAKVFLDL